jgi:hypothetical protein
MEKGHLKVLKADINAQMSLIQNIFVNIEERAEGLSPGNLVRMESVAYQIHNLYNAVEDLLKLIAAHFENQITDTARWHSALLQRMTQEVEGIRPALLSQETYSTLNSLRGFRHFFRHAYGVPIDYAQLKINLDKAQSLQPRLRQDIECFLEALQ